MKDTPAAAGKAKKGTAVDPEEEEEGETFYDAMKVPVQAAYPEAITPQHANGMV